MSKSRFQKYWSRIDNCPGSLERLSPEQTRRLKVMVKAAFHAGHGEYRDRITKLEAEQEYATRLLNDSRLGAKQRIGELEAQIKVTTDLYFGVSDD